MGFLGIFHVYLRCNHGNIVRLSASEAQSSFTGFPLERGLLLRVIRSGKRGFREFFREDFHVLLGFVDNLRDFLDMDVIKQPKISRNSKEV